MREHLGFAFRILFYLKTENKAQYSRLPICQKIINNKLNEYVKLSDKIYHWLPEGIILFYDSYLPKTSVIF